MANNSPCAVEGCEAEGRRRRGWCDLHYLRWRLKGDPGPVDPLVVRDPWKKVDKGGDPSACWHWRGVRNAKGYGVVQHEGTSWLAHRLIYTLSVGPILGDLTLDHLCVNPPCVNPAHLEPVTASENLRRRHQRNRQIAAG